MRHIRHTPILFDWLIAYLGKRLAILSMIGIDMYVFLYFIFLFSPVKQTITGAKLINLHIVWIVPLAVVLDSRNILSGTPGVRKFVIIGFISGLIAPLYDLFSMWWPAILDSVGIYDEGACSLLLEDFSDSLHKRLKQILPTAVFGATAWMLLFLLNRSLVKAYYYVYIPAAKSLREWLKQVYRY